MPICLSLAGVEARTKEELMDQYFSERLCLEVDNDRVRNELSHLWLPPLVEHRARVDRMKTSNLLRDRISALTALDAMEALSVQAVRGSISYI